MTMTMTTQSQVDHHQSVLLNECIEALNIRPDGIYLDGTFGRGGHARAILSCLNDKGRLICIDKDPEAIAAGQAMMGDDPRVSFYHVCFSQLDNIVYKNDLTGRLDGILLDLGFSSPQIMKPERGFSFYRDGPLDMRLDPTQSLTVQRWLATADVKEVTQVLREYGEESFARKIALAIERFKETKPLETTLELAQLVSDCYPKAKVKPGQHPATKTFQAFRIFINQEIASLKTVLPTGLAALAPGGRFAIISFHSLEDRMVKRFFRHQSQLNIPKEILIIPPDAKPRMQWVVKRQYPLDEEIALNPRARSAILRVGEKTGIA